MRVLVACKIDDSALDKLSSEGLDVDYRPSIDQDTFDSIYNGYEAVIVRSNVKVRPVRGVGSLRIVVRAGAGLDNVDVEGLEGLGVRVLNTPESVAQPVAELTIGLMISLARRIPYAVSAMREGKWVKGELLGVELEGKTLGIIGFGRIGRRVARAAAGLGMRILVNDIIAIPEDVLRGLSAFQVQLDTLLAESDFVSIHTPLTSDTLRMIGEEELRKMKPTAYLINVSRGGVVDEGALKRALREGWIAGAALDVFQEEPPNDMELLSLPNLIATPHIGAQSKEAQRRASIEAAELVIRELKASSA